MAAETRGVLGARERFWNAGQEFYECSAKFSSWAILWSSFSCAQDSAGSDYCIPPLHKLSPVVSTAVMNSQQLPEPKKREKGPLEKGYKRSDLGPNFIKPGKWAKRAPVQSSFHSHSSKKRKLVFLVVWNTICIVVVNSYIHIGWPHHVDKPFGKLKSHVIKNPAIN